MVGKAKKALSYNANCLSNVGFITENTRFDTHTNIFCDGKNNHTKSKIHNIDK